MIEWKRLEEHTGEDDCHPPAPPPMQRPYENADKRSYKRVMCPECNGYE